MKKVGNVLRLAAPLYVEGLATEHRESAVGVINEALTIAGSLVDELRNAADDVTLTAQGRAVRAEKAKAAALAALGSIEESKTAKLVARAAASEKALLVKAIPAIPKDSATEMQLREIRDQLRVLSAEERLSVYRTTSDPFVLTAIETASPTLNQQRRRFEPFVDPEEIATVQRVRAEAADPTAAATLRQLRDLADVHRLAINSVRQDIVDLSTVAV